LDKKSEKAEQGVQRVSFFVVLPEFALWDIIPLEKLVVSHVIKKFMLVLELEHEGLIFCLHKP
jgi:3-dehydroquinate synthase class II